MSKQFYCCKTISMWMTSFRFIETPNFLSCGEDFLVNNHSRWGTMVPVERNSSAMFISSCTAWTTPVIPPALPGVCSSKDKPTYLQDGPGKNLKSELQRVHSKCTHTLWIEGSNSIPCYQHCNQYDLIGGSKLTTTKSSMGSLEVSGSDRRWAWQHTQVAVPLAHEV